MILDLSTELIIALFFIAAAAGFIDAIAGGGGLLTIPALLFTGMTPVQAIATNKLQAIFGSFSATRFFIKEGLLHPWSQRWSILATALGAALGAISLQFISADILIRIMPFALIVIALYLAINKSFGQSNQQAKLNRKQFDSSAIPTIGFYDGFFGPGTGTFFALSYSKLRGFNLIKATAHAKLMNFTTNFVSLAIFIFADQIVWLAGLTMAAGQIIGARLGARSAVKNGVDFIRYLTIFICIAMSISLFLK